MILFGEVLLVAFLVAFLVMLVGVGVFYHCFETVMDKREYKLKKQFESDMEDLKLHVAGDCRDLEDHLDKNTADMQRMQEKLPFFIYGATRGEALMMAAALHHYLSLLEQYTELGTQGQDRHRQAKSMLAILEAKLGIDGKNIKAL